MGCGERRSCIARKGYLERTSGCGDIRSFPGWIAGWLAGRPGELSEITRNTRELSARFFFSPPRSNGLVERIPMIAGEFANGCSQFQIKFFHATNRAARLERAST